MSDSWDERRKAREEEYFLKVNQEAMERLKRRQEEKPRPSPITGEPMEQLTMKGVLIDRCPTSGGIWLDAGELEQILEAAKSKETGEPAGYFTELFTSLLGGKRP